MKREDNVSIALRAFERHEALHPMSNYPGVLSLHGLGRLARITGREDLLEKTRTHLRRFLAGEYGEFHCNFKNYYCGGNATAYLFHEGVFPEAAEAVERYAEELMREAPRDPDGIFCMPRDEKRRQVWIDVAFAVGPFLLYTGLALGRREYVDEVCSQVEKMVRLFHDPANGLLHQARDFQGPGVMTEDHWGRGNGWGILALAELAAALPADHPFREEARRMFLSLCEACLDARGPSGLWHQQMSCHDSYVETSGSGLILYAFGVGLEHGLLPESFRAAFEERLRGMLDYLTSEGDVFHTCRGCLAPGQGREVDYMARAPIRNDPHAFGPVILAFGQAAALELRPSAGGGK